LFLPIWFLVPNLALAAGLFALVFGMQAAASALLGMMLSVLHYEWVHYVAHIPYRPRTRLGRWIKQYHLRHHFISEKHWFGVSNPALDGVLGTLRGPGAAEKSPTTRNRSVLAVVWLQLLPLRRLCDHAALPKVSAYGEPRR
jgi:sterol desaturase/sphingolipid hydroxylase (fatty acid hydroxylase superfamily)